ncbi:surface antigen (D15) [[Leptolyngbya] sp. PCC 7376]|uniref:ShlB/FhaC/HecB family hemolysin secretion/activation protein n=1 Tax=[Leptolyngbya] sp. PCC 7376 TaxID=111781 RepID=UPI00029F3B3D|nr:ShlB/FhaC/HecB family hemolysin secretion/activation protein [[Leptolyngbya] sp. PCC 7376]AFY38529.1 surface antigen (D15) [[Leptolyngbya] sp. PCC 7376]
MLLPHSSQKALTQRSLTCPLSLSKIAKTSVGCGLGLGMWLLQGVTFSGSAIAQIPTPERPGTSPSLEQPSEAETLPALPTLEDLLGPDFVPAAPSEVPLPGDGITFTVEQFMLTGSTVYEDTDFAEIFAQYTDRQITFEEVLKVRDAITQRYRDDNYLTSGAIIPPQSLQDGVVEIQIVEGRVEDIVIEGNDHLKAEYVRSRLGLGAQTPLRISDLLEQIQLLQLNPLLENISADLQAGTVPGTNLLVVTVNEADSFDVAYQLDNNRSPSVGTLRHRLSVREGNLIGYGDAISANYSHTEGSDSFDLSYTLPVSPHNTSVTAYYSTTNSDVIEDPFTALDASSEASVVELTVQHPLIETPTTDLVLGLIGSHQRTQTSLGIDNIGGFPLSAGADNQGRTKVSALRFFQAWSKRSPEQVIAVRSQFNFGLDAFGSTINDDADVPDSRYFSWLGQGQWVRLLAPDTPLIVRGSLQLTPDSLLSLERYGLGGQSTVRGYRQDVLLTDNGAALSVEARIPLWQDSDRNLSLQLTPFIDSGVGWNNQGANPERNSLLGVGTGLRLQYGDASLRFDWGVPLIKQSDTDKTLQEQGLYFTLNVPFF